jgi:rhodanese-related sulfurtransferase
MTKWLALAALLLIVAGCSDPPYTNLDNDGVKAQIAQGVPVYDVRRPDEWRQTGVLEGSRMLTWIDGSGRPDPQFLSGFLAEVGKNDPVVIICRTGNRTGALARELAEKHGYTRVYNVRDGIVRWIGEGNPVVRP